MEEHKMVHNANQIAQFFAAYSHDEAVAGVEDHLKKYWVPRMRRQIIDYVAAGGADLHSIAIEAVKRLPAPAVR